MDSFLDIIGHNIWIGTNPREGRRWARKLINEHDPEILTFLEATRMHGDLDGLGYRVFQLAPKPKRRGNLPGDANVALMVRKDVKVVASWAMRMRTFWKGPKHGKAQDPRVYRAVNIRWCGRTWKIGVAHTPFGETARRESRNRLVRWFRRTVPGRPTILIIDSNMSKAEFNEQIADPVDATVRGHRIDIAAFKNVHLEEMKNLGKGPSDGHPAMLYTFSAKAVR